MHNHLSDIAGLAVGHAQHERLASGVTAIVFERPAVASVCVLGGAPGGRDTGLLEPEMTVETVDAILVSGGSAFGLDAAGGAQAALAAAGRGFAVGPVRVPIVPQAILFDLLNGGDKNWGARPPYWELGRLAAERALAGHDASLGSVGVGLGATTANLKGGIGAASAETCSGLHVAALMVVNAIGTATTPTTSHARAASVAARPPRYSPRGPRDHSRPSTPAHQRGTRSSPALACTQVWDAASRAQPTSRAARVTGPPVRRGRAGRPRPS